MGQRRSLSNVVDLVEYAGVVNLYAKQLNSALSRLFADLVEYICGEEREEIKLVGDLVDQVIRSILHWISDLSACRVASDNYHFYEPRSVSSTGIDLFELCHSSDRNLQAVRRSFELLGHSHMM